MFFETEKHRIEQLRVSVQNSSVAQASYLTGMNKKYAAQAVLRSLNVPVRPHAARNLTPELAHEAEMIFCMTSAHRTAVIELIPSVAWKTYCLDPEADLEDPIGMGLAVYVNCARRIQNLVRLRFDEISLRG